MRHWASTWGSLERTLAKWCIESLTWRDLKIWKVRMLSLKNLLLFFLFFLPSCHLVLHHLCFTSPTSSHMSTIWPQRRPYFLLVTKNVSASLEFEAVVGELVHAGIQQTQIFIVFSRKHRRTGRWRSPEQINNMLRVNNSHPWSYTVLWHEYTHGPWDCPNRDTVSHKNPVFTGDEGMSKCL